MIQRLKSVIANFIRNPQALSENLAESFTSQSTPSYDLTPEDDLTAPINEEYASRLIKAYEDLNKPPSVLFFTTHKCASIFMSRILSLLTQESNYRLVDYSDIIWRLGETIYVGNTYEPFLENSYSYLYLSRGEIYAPQRYPINFPGKEDFKHIFFLRDPRDVLISAYYSFAFTHPLPENQKTQDEVLNYRQYLQEIGLDAYVLEAVNYWIIPVYKEYQNCHSKLNDSLFLSYQDYTNDTRNFIQKVANYLSLPLSNDILNLLVAEASPIQEIEDISSHKRSGKNGQYLDKLKSETIQQLNSSLAEVLSYWGFS